MADPIPRREHPRPGFVRPRWFNLNGAWEFAFDADNVGVKEKWHDKRTLGGSIVVPYPPEGSASGVGDTGFHPVVWYARTFEGEAAWNGQRALLHFGAVDYACRVWLNGEEVGKHRGGYTPFVIDVTSKLKRVGNRLVVRAEDRPRSSSQPRGRQSDRLESHGPFHPRTTGIWQTVWLEGVGESYIERSTKLAASLATRQLTVLPTVGGAGASGLSLRVEVFEGRERVAHGEGWATEPVVVDVEKSKPWAPGNPQLYTLRMTLRHGRQVVDRVRSYCGFRDVSVEGDRILLNGEPLYQKLVVSPDCYPGGVYTALRDAAFRNDIRLAKSLGFNGARLGQKLADPRLCYWADRLGFLLWDEMPDWGLDIAKPSNRDTFEAEWAEAVRRDWNHPSVIAWVPFGERGGEHNSPDFPEDKDQQAFVERVHDLTKAMDPTRPVIDNDGFCHVKTDVMTVHDDSSPEQLAKTWKRFGASGEAKDFPRRTRMPHLVGRRRYKGEPVILSEVDGIRWPSASKRGERDGGDEPETLADAVRRYRDTVWTIMELDHVVGFCVARLADGEREQNGVCFGDRSCKVKPEALAAIHAGPKNSKGHPGATVLKKALAE